MNKLLFYLAAGIIFTACNQSDKKPDLTADPSDEQTMISNPLDDSANLTSIEWLDSTFLNLGKVNEGQKVEVNFRFKNTGDRSLIITSASASCGCTVPNPPKEPIAPGNEGSIKAVFDSKGRTGINTKEVFVSANTKPSASHTLSFQVEVIKN